MNVLFEKYIHSSASSYQPIPSTPPFLPTCRICSRHSENLRFVSLRTDKLVLLLCFILKNEISEVAARLLFLSGTLAVCHSHFSESLRILEKSLGVPDEKGHFPKFDDEQAVQSLLQLANFVRNNNIQLTGARILLLCSQFFEKYQTNKSLLPVEKSPTCNLCGIRRVEKDFTKISSISEKMIVLVTEVTK